ncbi:hypothetical protein [Rhizobiales bacterium 3FA27D7]|jgi:hypothetical protein|uniref:hypothetical protein n=1 Tax=Mesorhizobium sp. 2RAF21 TaxID=3232995 RepID=UPI0010F46DC0
MKRIGTMVFCLVAASTAATAEPLYGASTEKLETIQIRSDEPETDALLFATCITPDMFEVLIGNELPLGRGEHEPVSLSLAAGTLSTKVDGVSVKSPDYEMTGNAMLLTTLEPKGRAWRILTSGQPIEMRPKGSEPATVPLGKAETDALKAFARKCS